jgi:hypothetical protein
MDEAGDVKFVRDPVLRYPIVKKFEHLAFLPGENLGCASDGDGLG